MQGLDQSLASIVLIVRMDLIAFLKTVKGCSPRTFCFKTELKFYGDQQFKYNAISILACCKLVAEWCFFFLLIAFTLPVIVMTICLFDNFEKLSILIKFFRGTLKVRARGCYVGVFLVLYIFVLVFSLFISLFIWLYLVCLCILFIYLFTYLLIYFVYVLLF